MFEQLLDVALALAGLQIGLDGLGEGEEVLWVEIDFLLGTQLAIQADLVRFGFVSFASALVYALLALPGWDRSGEPPEPAALVDRERHDALLHKNNSSICRGEISTCLSTQ
ncbi:MULTISPECIES: hypothetical protein [unclassified Mesorhizobium]|uniref:hypothetical protein n=1 Tax=unclassified Mesorhizobium TaxID=325217 RepID=UPI000FE8235A|nr:MULTISPECIES: hypothetical protein [unclassified Mesorhizobium]RWI97805.1 MAG: hypothetical protein EOR22_05570 [Mesorhizobium sp.]